MNPKAALYCIRFFGRNHSLAVHLFAQSFHPASDMYITHNDAEQANYAGGTMD